MVDEMEAAGHHPRLTWYVIRVQISWLSTHIENVGYSLTLGSWSRGYQPVNDRKRHQVDGSGNYE